MAGKIRRELGDGYGGLESPGNDKASRYFLSAFLFRQQKRTDSQSGGLGNNKRSFNVVR